MRRSAAVLILGLTRASRSSSAPPSWSYGAISTLLTHTEDQAVALSESYSDGDADAVGTNENGHIVKIGLGQYLRGHVDNATGQRRFMGIDYAAPPVGERRWRAPFPSERWTGVREALEPGSVCLQSDNELYTVGTNMSEDCLNLNVYTPAFNNDEEARPVMLFFYGGSWYSGSAACPLYYGGTLVENSGDAIVVTVNYRVNGFGFLGAEALREPADGTSPFGDDGSTGNWGLLDQRMAMRWVQENIGSFGGDPSRVMIFGESAGAGSVANHLVSKKSWAAADGPLFSRALMESGSPATPWNSQNMTYAESRARHFAAFLNCSDPSDVVHDVTEEEVACMRSRDAADVLAARRGMPDSILTWSPVEDGVQLTEAPMEAVAAGAIATNISIVLGTNADEGSEFTGLAWDATEADYEAYVVELFGAELAELALAQYPASEYNVSGYEGKAPAGHGPYYASSRMFGDAVFSCPARRTARAWANAEAAPAYLYFVNHTLSVLREAQDLDPNLQPPPYDQMGVFHGTELGFVFDFEPALDLVEAPPTDIYTESQLAKLIGSYWGTFAATGVDPSPDDTAVPAWAPFTKEEEVNVYLDTARVEASASGLKSDKCDFWDQHRVPVTAVFGPPVF